MKKAKSKLTNKPPSWARLIGQKKKRLKTKVPKGEIWDGHDSPYSIETNTYIKIDIEQYTKMWLTHELDEIRRELQEGKTVWAYKSVKELQKRMLSKEKIISIVRHYDKNENTNQIKTLSRVDCYIKWARVEELEAKKEKSLAKRESKK